MPVVPNYAGSIMGGLQFRSTQEKKLDAIKKIKVKTAGGVAQVVKYMSATARP
jgi:hypothetical protein